MENKVNNFDKLIIKIQEIIKEKKQYDENLIKHKSLLKKKRYQKLAKKFPIDDYSDSDLDNFY